MLPPAVNPAILAPRQRHVLTVLFTDLVGSTSLGRRVEAEVLADLLDALRQVWHEAAQRHGGTVLRTQGDGALLVFGYPDPCEDGGRRAADAAFEIHERAACIRSPGDPNLPAPQMRSGIAAGVVLVSAGDIERGHLDLVGDVANSAAGLLKLTPPGGIVAHEDALGPHANFFDHVSLTPPNTLRLLGRKGVQRRFDATTARGLTPLVDRGRALQRVAAFVNHLGPAAGRCLLLEADAGVGKTRLLDEVVQRARSRALVGTCESYMLAGALQPFVSMLRQQAPPAGVPQPEPPAASPERLLEVFRGWSAIEPLTIIVDDWQWADDASRQLVQALLQGPVGPRVLLACRPREDGARWIADAGRELLTPLSLSGTEVAVRRWLPDVDPFLAERIHAHTGGVPLYVEELCRSSSAATLARSLDGEGGTPAWLAAWVAGRLQRLPARLGQIVRAAAVAGVSVPVATLELACACTLDGATLNALADADLLYVVAGQRVVRFKHGLTREAVYESMARADRRRWHETMRTLLLREAEAAGPADQDDQVEALAYHCQGAGLWPESAACAERAGDRASAAFALDSARKWYLAAMDAMDRVPARGRELSLRWCLVSNKLGMTCIFDPLAQRNDAGPFEKAVAIARELQDDDVLARALYWLGYMYYGFGRYRASAQQLQAARALAEQAGDARLATQVDATLAQVLAAASRYDEAIRLFDAALTAKQRQARPGSGMAIGSTYTLACKGSVLADRGEFDAAHACFDEALALLGDTTHPVANSVRNWVAVACIWQGRLDEAERIAAESARIAENTRGLLLLVVCRAAAGYARWARTGDERGLELAADAVNWMDARGGRFYTSLHHGWLVDAYATLGMQAQARRHAAHVLWRSREGERLGEASASRALARLALRAGHADDARCWLARAARSAQARASRRETALNHVVAAALAEHHGEAAWAADLRQQALLDFNAMGMSWHARQLAAGPARA
jgi:class 3 adenylate cyclase/tetratricopeptide (TPR) repeat protein